MDNKKEKMIASKEIYKGHILDLYVDDVLLPNGHTSKREVIRHCKAAAVLAFDENDNIILEDQYRYPYDAVLKEIPAGKCDKGEDSKDTAIRELEEETGYKANHLEFLGTFYPTVAYTDEIIDIYLATDLERTHQHLDENESLDYYKIPFAMFLDLIHKGEIQDGKTLAAVTYYLLRGKK